MTIKSDYTPEEWRQLLQAPGAAGIYIMMVDRNFVIGNMKEALAVSASILSKEKKENNSELLAVLLAEFQNREMVKQSRLEYEKKDVASVKQTALDALKNAAGILAQKATPEETKEIKTWLYDVSVETANAAKEGGFLGFGGTKVSEKEKAALQEISILLKLDEPVKND